MEKLYDMEELIRTERYYTFMNTASDDTVHRHTFWELVYQIQGLSENFVNGKQIFLSEGHALLMKPDDVHKISFKTKAKTRDLYIRDEKMRKILQFFESDLYKRFTETTEPIVFPIDAGTIATLEENLLVFNLTTARTDELEDIHTSIVFHILGFYVKNRLCFQNSIPQWLTDLLLNLSDEKFLAQKVSDIVKTTNYSYGHVAREFKKYMNVSLKSYILQTRLKRATYLLILTDESISLVSEKVGFNSVNGFINAFTACYKLSPAKYRKYYSSRSAKETAKYATPPPKI